MAKMHHCPNDGAQPCNAAGSIIHVCPLCYARWDEVIPEDEPAPAPTTPASKEDATLPAPTAVPSPHHRRSPRRARSLVSTREAWTMHETPGDASDRRTAIAVA